MGRSLALALLAAFAACDCGYRAHAPGHAASQADAGLDAGQAEQDAGEGTGPWILQQGGLELAGLGCPIAEGQTVFVSVTVVAPAGCDEPGPVEVRRTGRAHELRLEGWYWAPAVSPICSDMSLREERWVNLGALERGTWTLRVEVPPAEATLEVAPPSGNACAERPVARGGACEQDCDCASGRCVAGINGTACVWTCADEPCGTDLDCLQGRCESEMTEAYREGFEECRPTNGPCAVDADCPPAQRCGDVGCTFRDVAEPFAPCTDGSQCASGWSCVVDEFDLAHGVCAVRCFTDHTSCPIGQCLASPGFGPRWTCSFLAD